MPRETTRRYAVGSLLAILALNAFAGGYYGLAGAKGVPVEWLAGSPFPDYTIPGLLLIFVVGGTALGAAMAVFADLASARTATLAAGVVLLGWIAAQLLVIGYASWLQPAMALFGALLVVLALRQPPPPAS
ncbi:hypothetical protein OV203_21705 [Nannocystis sp. ILAH1]|uniref:hypothetical protein n=1 Tax=Nannocystis sp. ILAH1 TaxID=2996789 RepID=UPI00227086CE|nr:hypothetical protein [Nannocystis sp. ILAH1]MCY0989768.1 hypothetical protein [Nannocystis sp. ILAH1]